MKKRTEFRVNPRQGGYINCRQMPWGDRIEWAWKILTGRIIWVGGANQ